MKVIRGTVIEYSPASHEDPRDPGCLKRILAGRDDLCAGRVQMINWCRIPAGKAFRQHYHESMQEIFVILDGDVVMTVGGEPFSLQAGDAALVEPMEVHQMSNLGERDVHYLVAGIASAPGGKTVVCD